MLCAVIGEDWNLVVMETAPVSFNWEKLVVYLGLSFDLIDNTIRNASDSWSEALKQWIKQNYNTKKYSEPSWRTLLRAVAQVNKLQFKALADKHKGIRPSPLCSIQWTFRTITFNLTSHNCSSNFCICYKCDVC